MLAKNSFCSKMDSNFLKLHVEKIFLIERPQPQTTRLLIATNQFYGGLIMQSDTRSSLHFLSQKVVIQKIFKIANCSSNLTQSVFTFCSLIL